jgi:hypothetical protein
LDCGSSKDLHEEEDEGVFCACGWFWEGAWQHRQYLLEQISKANMIKRADLALQGAQLALDIKDKSFEDVRQYAELVNEALCARGFISI